MGHPAIADLFSGPVIVQEKVDGSQFSFGIIDGELLMRSKRVEVYGPEGIFAGAVETARDRAERGLLVEGWVYRGEALQKPKHNALKYERVPAGNLILFDVDTGLEDRVGPDELAAIASNLSMEAVPMLYTGEVHDLDALRDLLSAVSVLGGPVEGVVAKNYAAWGRDGKMLMGKVVRDEFRELNKKTHAKPGRGDIIANIADMLATDARFQKAVQRLRDDGSLQNAPQDIGPLMREVQTDIEEEAGDEIRDLLWQHFRKDILRGASKGVPHWYKARLLESQFEGDADAD